MHNVIQFGTKQVFLQDVEDLLSFRNELFLLNLLFFREGRFLLVHILCKTRIKMMNRAFS